MSKTLDTLYDKQPGFKFRDPGGYVWKRTKDGWIALDDPDGDVWSDEDLAEHIEDLNYEQEMEVNFDYD